MMPKIPPYSLEFRSEAVRLLRSSGRSVPQLARELGVSPQSLRHWSVQRDVDEGKAEGLSHRAAESARPAPGSRTDLARLSECKKLQIARAAN
ncbi:MAG: transposase [Acidobacteriota bacterium]|nr:transposase [Acidobacteriota bacterium]